MSAILKRLVAFLLPIVSFAAVFWDVTQRSPKESFFWERCVKFPKTAAKETILLLDGIPIHRRVTSRNKFGGSLNTLGLEA